MKWCTYSSFPFSTVWACICAGLDRPTIIHPWSCPIRPQAKNDFVNICSGLNKLRQSWLQLYTYNVSGWRCPKPKFCTPCPWPWPVRVKGTDEARTKLAKHTRVFLGSFDHGFSWRRLKTRLFTRPLRTSFAYGTVKIIGMGRNLFFWPAPPKYTCMLIYQNICKFQILRKLKIENWNGKGKRDRKKKTKNRST